MNHVEDLQLSYAQKIKLIKGIEYWQQQRWKRLKRFHNMDHIQMNLRHFFMKNEINLIRNQKKRLQILKQSILQ